jgi:hypothetical protein
MRITPDEILFCDAHFVVQGNFSRINQLHHCHADRQLVDALHREVIL